MRNVLTLFGMSVYTIIEKSIDPKTIEALHIYKLNDSQKKY